MSDKTVPEALQNCVANSTLLIGDNYIFIIISIVFYYVIQHSKNLVDIEKNNQCDKTINRGLYDGFISALVYWIISFTMFIFIKYNGLSTVNYFIWQKEKLNTNISLIKNNNPSIKNNNPLVKNLNRFDIVLDRSKFISQNILSLVFSVLNVVYSITLLVVLYDLIKMYIELVECEKPTCTASELCDKNKSAVYIDYSSGIGKCLDKDFKPIVVKGSQKTSPTSELTKYLTGNASGVYNTYTKMSWVQWVNLFATGFLISIYIFKPLLESPSPGWNYFMIFVFIVMVSVNVVNLIHLNTTYKEKDINKTTTKSIKSGITYSTKTSESTNTTVSKTTTTLDNKITSTTTTTSDINMPINIVITTPSPLSTTPSPSTTPQ